VTYRLLRRLDELTRNGNDTMILTVLADGPLRFTEVHRALAERLHTHLGDTQLSRCLSRMIDRGIVERARTGRITAYRLTDKGAYDAATLRVLVAALAAHEPDPKKS
jgi:DNA-binding HxlR family transcriptional regulator